MQEILFNLDKKEGKMVEEVKSRRCDECEMYTRPEAFVEDMCRVCWERKERNRRNASKVKKIKYEAGTWGSKEKKVKKKKMPATIKAYMKAIKNRSDYVVVGDWFAANISIEGKAVKICGEIEKVVERQ